MVRAMARILIIDPSPEISELLAHALGRLGHEPVTAAAFSADDEAPSIDAALIEPAFPETFAAATRLRELRPRLPIVCLSIYPKSVAVAALAPIAYLLKPFTLAELERTLIAALDSTLVEAV
jgi:DNA-binding response OmpR family regulator